MAYASLIVYILILFIRPQEWVPGMLNWPIMNAIMGVAIFATLFKLSDREWNFRKTPQNWLVLGFFVAVLMSHVSHLYLAGTKLAFTEFGKIVLLYFLISINLSTFKRVRGFVPAIVAGCLFMAIHAILQIHTGSGFGGQVPLFIPREVTPRAVAFGFFEDPNDLALALVVALPCVINGIHRAGVSPIWRIVSLALAGTLGYAVFLTNSRGGWLALAVMVICYFLLNFGRKKVSIVLGGLAVVVLMMIAPGRVSTISAQEGSARGRLIAWADGNRMLKQWPVFGVGKGRYSEYSEDGKVAHNSFVHCYGELGLFGYFWWIGLLYASVKDCLAMRKHFTSEDPEQRELVRLAMVLLSAFIGYLTAAIFLSRTYTPLLFILFGLIAALRTVYERQFGALEGAMTRRDLKYVLLVELASIPVVYLYLRVAV